MTPPRRVTVNEVGNSVEVTSWVNQQGGVSVLVSPAEWAALVARAEGFTTVRAYRSAEARIAHSHGARGA